MIKKEQMANLKEELLEQKKQLEITDDEDSFRNRSAHENIGELSLYDNHPADAGTGFYEREKDMALSVHAQDELGKVEHALQAMEKGTYGQCEVCGGDIPYERLEALPSTTFCIDHSPEQRVPGDRPVEEDVLEPAHDNSFSYRLRSPVKDYEDSFEEVAKFGTSETPSDFVGDYDDYNELYQDESKDGTQEEYETFSVTDISGDHRSTLQIDEKEEYEERLDDTGMESPLGDIPYKEKDSYLDDDDSD
ncbi:TraR/DksA C4-type zinc finger protein [Lederbergia galactosidilytica]|uniref:Molecular chaperone DnaK n=1 Tax=Lederbergia galactosidilytica TaxID=217031 RepID=A0A178A0M5_9BACI|nr:TraR/DksA C4-type zinc finger protein [Lederbergia galactosidilytica]OAK72648.1 molecular chaperone DnaK [Lederbergia galactosidilytica]OAK74775.1 molecular chaperone DnaK [Lederbergia galactosidilytica]